MRLGQSLAIDNVFAPSVLPPTALSGLAVWLSATTGATLTSASVSNDTLATWTPNQLTSRTDNGDGTVTLKENTVTATHTISNTQANILAGPTVLDIWVKDVDSGFCVIQLCTGVRIGINLGTAASVSPVGGATATLVSGGVGTLQHWQIGGTYSSAGASICLSRDGSTISYAGTSKSLIVGTGATFGPTAYQDRLSALNGVVNNTTQGTDASRMLFRRLNASGIWVASTDTTGAAEFGWPLDAVRSLAFANGFYDLWTHASAAQPITVVEIAKRYATPTATADSLAITGATAVIKPLSRTTGNVLTSEWKDDAATDKTGNFTGTLATSYQSIAAVFDGTTESVYVDGVLDATGAVNRAVGAQTMTAALLSSRGDMRKHFVVYNRALDIVTLRKVTNYLRIDSGMAAL